MSGFYLFLSSEDSSRTYPNNGYTDFIVEFDRQIILEDNCGLGWKQEWSFALADISIDFLNSSGTIPEPVVVICDLAIPSYIKATEAGVLRTIVGSAETGLSLYNTYYIGVNKASFNRIRIQLKSQSLEALNTKLGWPSESVLKCTLHFQRA